MAATAAGSWNNSSGRRTRRAGHGRQGARGIPQLEPGVELVLRQGGEPGPTGAAGQREPWCWPRRRPAQPSGRDRARRRGRGCVPRCSRRTAASPRRRRARRSGMRCDGSAYTLMSWAHTLTDCRVKVNSRLPRGRRVRARQRRCPPPPRSAAPATSSRRRIAAIPGLIDLLVRRVGDPHLAQDLLHDAIVTTLGKLQDGAPGAAGRAGRLRVPVPHSTTCATIVATSAWPSPTARPPSAGRGSGGGAAEESQREGMRGAGATGAAGPRAGATASCWCAITSTRKTNSSCASRWR